MRFIFHLPCEHYKGNRTNSVSKFKLGVRDLFKLLTPCKSNSNNAKDRIKTLNTEHFKVYCIWYCVQSKPEMMITLQSDNSNYWPGVNNTAMWVVSQIHMNGDQVICTQHFSEIKGKNDLFLSCKHTRKVLDIAHKHSSTFSKFHFISCTVTLVLFFWLWSNATLWNDFFTDCFIWFIIMFYLFLLHVRSTNSTQILSIVP